MRNTQRRHSGPDRIIGRFRAQWLERWLTPAKQLGYGAVGSLSMLPNAKNKKAAGTWIASATNAENTKKSRRSAAEIVLAEIERCPRGEPLRHEVTPDRLDTTG